jgi:hypothetical protein
MGRTWSSTTSWSCQVLGPPSKIVRNIFHLLCKLFWRWARKLSPSWNVYMAWASATTTWAPVAYESLATSSPWTTWAARVPSHPTTISRPLTSRGCLVATTWSSSPIYSSSWRKRERLRTLQWLNKRESWKLVVWMNFVNTSLKSSTYFAAMDHVTNCWGICCTRL